MVRSPAAPTPTPRSPAAPTRTPSSPAAPTPSSPAPTPTPGSPAAPTPGSRAAPTPIPSSPAADLENYKGTSELLRAIKIEKANGLDIEEHKGAGDELAEEDGEGMLDDWDKHLRAKRSHNSNELQRYLEEDLFPRRQKFDILKWWEIHSPKYPVLAAIARDILAVSVSTVPAEAAFSNAGRIITEQRSSLTPSTVETLMCLEDWLRAADRQNAEPTVGDHGGEQDDAGTS